MIKKLNIILILISIIGNVPWVYAGESEGNRGNYVKKEYYDNGNPKLYLKFRNELIVRKKSYYRNGRVREDWVYRDGEMLRVVHYYESGRLRSVWTKKSGVTKQYDPDGRLRTTVDLRPENLNPGLPSSLIFSGP
ncbi:MAG: hypothetical protein WC450_01840 [Candidatus Omnitrophota bacterium]|jgi:antitoxin component YwqK of YwqJK toxin-antitoxin module